MAHITVQTDVPLDEPVLVEGLPGVGLVGKIATDHVVDQLSMTYYASVTCEGLPRIAVYGESGREVRPPVRLYADAEHDLVALQSDVPISRTAAGDFASCLTGWLADHDALPLYLSGLPVEEQDVAGVPSLYGIATGTAGDLLDEYDVATPTEMGVVGGPTGALLNHAAESDLDAVGLVVESDPRFPDPAAARKLIVDGINPLAGIDVTTDDLVERAEEISEQKAELAKRMHEAEEKESSQAQPLRMFQ